ncbi:MAG: hypothetical protein PHQ14_00200 [Chromatiales bacterium]|nr:hypothetical protein [Chromatiales bacterium]MDX9765860.1 FimV/HubP family polar landmark protein [Ectothiorhodospiraceae bacterium]
MRRLALGLTLLGLFLLPGLTQALGLGNIEVNSALNQPLRAQIELVSTRPDELVGLDVRLASDDLFTRMGIEREFYLTELVFTPIIRPDGVPVVQVTTKSPVREPFLNFLIEATWPRGRLVREYTLLLDPPATFEEELPPPVAVPAIVRRPAEPPASEPYYAPPPRQPAPAAPRAAAPTRSIPDTYRVGGGQTLWSIAEDVRPDAGVTMNQVMIALQRLNPEAFDRGNINLVRSGYVLRVPSREEISAVPAAQAQREVRQQTAQWRELRAGLAARPAAVQPTATPSQALAAAPAESAPPVTVAPASPDAPAAAPAPADAQLKILSAPTEDSARAAATAREEAQPAEVAKIEQELALARETAESRRVENEELSARVTELEGLLEKKDQLLTLAQDQLADLEKRMARLEGREPAAGFTPPDLSLDSLMENPNLLLMAGGILLLVLLLVMLLVRRLRNRGYVEKLVEVKKAKKGKAEKQDKTGKKAKWWRRKKGEEAPEPEAEEVAASAMLAGATHGLTVSELPSEEYDRPTPQAMTVESAPERPAPAMEAPAPAPAAPAALADVTADTGKDDVLTEADVYLAYGLYQQAEGLLKNAIAEAPDRNDYRLKLLETCFATRNKGAFDTAAQELYDGLQGDTSDPLWAKAEAMGRELSPESALFGGKGGIRPGVKAAPAVAAAVAASAVAAGTATEPDLSDEDLADLNFSLDIEPEAETETGAAAPPAGDGGLEELDFGTDDQIARLMDESGLSAETTSAEPDFDMGMIEEPEPQVAASEAGTPAPAEDDIFDFDLGQEEAAPAEQPAVAEAPPEIDLGATEPAVGDVTGGEAEELPSENLEDFELDFLNEADALSSSQGVTTSLDDLDLDAFLEQPAGQPVETGAADEQAPQESAFDTEAESLESMLDLGDVATETGGETSSTVEAESPAHDPFDMGDLDIFDELAAEPDSTIEPAAEEEPLQEVDDLEFLKELEEAAAKDEAETLQNTGDIDVLDFGFVGEDDETETDEATATDVETEVAATQAFDDFDFGELDSGDGNAETTEPSAELSAGDIEDLDFDLDSLAGTADDDALEGLSLDFENDRGDEGMPLSGDEVATKLDLAKAYIDMEDAESARATLDEVMQEGNEAQRREAEELLGQLKG